MIKRLENYIVNLGFNAGKDQLSEKTNEYEIKLKMHKFLEMQTEINITSSMEEEIDFEGLSNYMLEFLIEDVKKYLFGETGERAAAKATIIAKACSYSKTHHPASYQRVEKLIYNILEILRIFYREKCDKSELLLTAEIEDTLIESVQKQTEIINEKLAHINKNGQSILEKLDECDKKIENHNGTFMNAKKKT